MPIGTSKSGLLGAGIVPGGSETFNSPGTFSVPAGVTLVNATGKGSDGNAGNAGNAGGRGSGGSGGAGGNIVVGSDLSGNSSSGACGAPGGNPGNSGNSGSASSSTAFSLSFPGGTGGTGGTGGPRGGGGNSGQAGGVYSCEIPEGTTSTGPRRNGGNSGPGGRGGQGVSQRLTNNPGGNVWLKRARGGGGGGGAGTQFLGGESNLWCSGPGGNQYGGNGACGSFSGYFNTCGQGTPAGSACPGGSNNGAGGGGGGGASAFQGNSINDCAGYYGAPGGGGGGRGDPGNPGNPGNPGSAANPTTHNCISVVSGANYSITANAPVTVSWDPQ
jgi:hypothetical protein